MTKSIDANNELYELCKQVYERLGWDVTKEFFLFCPDGSKYAGSGVIDTDKTIPLYTSDYLLEKLPNNLKDDDGNSVAPAVYKFPNQQKYRADYHQTFSRPLVDVYADTPLKALLKLTIALHEAGELK
jgi:hypothetical protein